MVFSILYRCISDRTNKSSKGTQLAHVRGLEPQQSGCKALIHHYYTSKPSPFLSSILQNPVPGLGREMAAYVEGRVQRLKLGSGRQWGWPLICLWPLPLTLGLGWGSGGKEEVRSPGGEVHLATGQALWRWITGHSDSSPTPLVSSIIYSCHPGHEATLGSGRNYSLGPALWGFCPQLRLKTSNPLP